MLLAPPPNVATFPPVPDLIGSDDIVNVHADLDAYVAWARELLWVWGILGAQEDNTCPEAVLSK